MVKNIFCPSIFVIRLNIILIVALTFDVEGMQSLMLRAKVSSHLKLSELLFERELTSYKNAHSLSNKLSEFRDRPWDLPLSVKQSLERLDKALDADARGDIRLDDLIVGCDGLTIVVPTHGIAVFSEIIRLHTTSGLNIEQQIFVYVSEALVAKKISRLCEQAPTRLDCKVQWNSMIAISPDYIAVEKAGHVSVYFCLLRDRMCYELAPEEISNAWVSISDLTEASQSAA